MQIIDRRPFTASVRTNLRGFQILSRYAATRPIAAINAIVLHQTGFNRGNGVESYDRVIAHYVVLQSGVVLQLRSLDALLNNAHARAGVSIEFVGNFMSDRSRAAGAVPTAAQVRAGRALVKHIRLEASGVRHILAHRQFNPTAKANCPGPHIWYNVAHWAETALGLSSAVRARGSIPDSWRDSRFALE